MKTLRLPFTILCVLAISALSAHAAQLASAKVLQVEGTVTKYTASGAQSPLKAGDILKEGDGVSATALSSAKLIFSNGSEITIEENTSLTISKLEQASFSGGQSYEQLQADPSQSQTLLELNYGALGFHVKKLQSGSTFEIETPLGTAAIRGTVGTVELFYNAERGEFRLVVHNRDGAVDFVSRYGGILTFDDENISDKGYNSAVAEKSGTIPTTSTVIIRLSRSDPYFDTLLNLLQNFVPTDPKPPVTIPIPGPVFTPDDPGITVVSPETSA